MTNDMKDHKKPEFSEGMRAIFARPERATKPNGKRVAKSLVLMGLFESVLFLVISLGFRASTEVLATYAAVGFVAGAIFALATDFLKMGLYWYYIVGGVIFFSFIYIANFVVWFMFGEAAF